MNEEKPLGLNIGSASILMIFAVLCLTVFSALSLVTAVSEKSTADKFAAATAEYYAADAACEQVRNELYACLSTGQPVPDRICDTQISEKVLSSGTLYSYAVSIGEGKSDLIVVLLYSGGQLRTVQWEKKESGEWSPDSTIEVWDFEALADAAENAA